MLIHGECTLCFCSSLLSWKLNCPTWVNLLYCVYCCLIGWGLAFFLSLLWGVSLCVIDKDLSVLWAVGRAGWGPPPGAHSTLSGKDSGCSVKWPYILLCVGWLWLMMRFVDCTGLKYYSTDYQQYVCNGRLTCVRVILPALTSGLER